VKHDGAVLLKKRKKLISAAPMRLKCETRTYSHALHSEETDTGFVNFVRSQKGSN
jgi:hypothetical protein